MGGRTKTTFGANTPEAKAALAKAVKNAHTPEAVKKQHETRKAHKLIRQAIFENLKADLMEANKAGKPYYSEYLDKFLADAKKFPGGKCGQFIANAIFQDGILQMLDDEETKAMNKDLDFIRYRVIKRLFKQQREVTLDIDKRKKCVICSRRAGKTDGNSSTIVYTAVEPNSPILYINKTFTNAINQQWQLVYDQAEAVGLQFAEGTSKSEGVMYFTNGSSVTFGGNNNDAEADKYRGGKYRLVIIDEAGHQRNMQYLIDEVIGPTLSDFADSIIILSGTPPRIPHTYVEKCWNSPEWTNYHWTMLDNPFMPNPQETIESVCRDKGLTVDSPFIQREYFGKIGIYDTEAQVFANRQTYEKGSIDMENLELPFSPTHVAIGVDFGYVDNNAVVTLAYNANTKQAVVLPNVRIWNKSTVSEIINEVQSHFEVAKKLAIRHNFPLDNISIFADNNEKSIVSEMSRNYDLPAHTCWKYKKDLAIAQLAEELRTGRMKIEKEGKLDEELDMVLYKRDETTDAITSELDEDLGIHPDGMFALLYASRDMFLNFGYETGGRSKEEI